MSPSTLFTNGRFFTGSGPAKDVPTFARCMFVEQGNISYIGDDVNHANTIADARGAIVHDCQGRYILPSFIDAHNHILMFGQSLQKLNLEQCTDLADIRASIRSYAQQHPKLARIHCGGWMEYMTQGKVDAKMLDDLDPRPIFIDARDLHSCWCNTAAIEEMGGRDLQDPVGGGIQRDSAGTPTGVFSEAACAFIIWPHLAKVASPPVRVEALRRGIEALHAAGCTGFIDMAMDEIGWDALCRLRHEERGRLPVHVAAHWIVKPTGTTQTDLEQVERAIELMREFNAITSPDFRIAGIKLICDGVVDSCTAALLEPYNTDGSNADTLWEPEALAAVVRAADEAGLQCALHAIGDSAVKLAIDTLTDFGRSGSRHRIEHLEVTSPGDAARLAAAGITASVQPAHADPTLLKEWHRLLGPHRLTRAFAYREFADAGANLAIGSDAPTASCDVLRNLYTGVTRKSVREPSNPTAMNTQHALSLCQAVTASSKGAAYSCFADTWVGSLSHGFEANFVIVDFEWAPEKLLSAKLCQTWYRGTKVFDGGP